jgi:hypothetical protein
MSAAIKENAASFRTNTPMAILIEAIDYTSFVA